MRKITALAFFMLLITAGLTAQSRFGIKGGLNFDSPGDLSNEVNTVWKAKTGYHLGVTYQVKVPFLGLALQPDLLFVRNSSELDGGSNGNNMHVDFLKLPLNVQLGLDLLLFRPFIMASPYVSYAIGKGDLLADVDWDDINRLDYGYALGGGIDIRKLQITAQYVWSLGKLQDALGTQFNADNIMEGRKMEGFHISVALFF